jgi:hypothetical protein
MKAYFFNIEKDTENKDVPVLDSYQVLPRTQEELWSYWESRPIVGGFDYNIQTGELIFTDWLNIGAAVPA